jgi:hypothetical protein
MLGLAWKSLGWFLAGVAVALGFLLVPLQVAAERKKLDRTAAEILRAKRDIRALETEFDTRASLAQLDKWNAESLGMVAPAADQFVADEAALASIEPTAAGAGPHMASFVPAAPVDAGVSQAPVAPAARGAMAAVAQPQSQSVSQPSSRLRSDARPRAALALLDRALLDDSVIGDLRSGARAEIGHQ